MHVSGRRRQRHCYSLDCREGLGGSQVTKGARGWCSLWSRPTRLRLLKLILALAGGAPVIFQDVVHSNGTREADCDEQSSFRGAIEWTFTRMPDSASAVERFWFS